MSPREMVVMCIFVCTTESGLLIAFDLFFIQVLFVKINSFLWIFPFLFFIVGYTTLSLLRGKQQISVPVLIGQTVGNATIILAEQHLNFRVLAQKEDNDLAQGTILSQIPTAGQFMRLNQAVFCVISKKTAAVLAPICVGATLSDVQNHCSRLNIIPQIFYVPSSLPGNTCIAQSPQAGEIINNKSITVYVANPGSSLVVVPSFIGSSLDSSLGTLELYQIKPLIIHAKKNTSLEANKNYTVAEQKPLAGSIIDINSLHTFQFLVE